MLDRVPDRLVGAASTPSLALDAALVSMREGIRDEPREGRLGLESRLLERMEPLSSYFSFSFSQLQPGSTARLLILSMSARLREPSESVATPSAKEVDGRSGDCCAVSLLAFAAGSCERD